MDFYSFDGAYVDRLKAGDSATEAHFVSYFSELIRIKLRSRMFSPSAIEDVRQETFYRVMVAVRSGDVIRDPSRLGAFVNSVCNNILLESYRSAAKNQHVDVETVDVADAHTNLEHTLLQQENSRIVREVLARLPERDRKCLSAIFLEERDKDAVCRELGVDRGYLRVLLHRAKTSFRAQYESGKAKHRLGREADD